MSGKVQSCKISLLSLNLSCPVSTTRMDYEPFRSRNRLDEPMLVDVINVILSACDNDDVRGLYLLLITAVGLSCPESIRD